MRRGRVIVGGFIVAIVLGGIAIYSLRQHPSADFHVSSPMPRGKVQPQLISIDDQAILLAPDGSLWAWGGRQFGLRGILNKPTVTVRPKRIGNDSDWNRIAANWSSTLAIKSDGSLWRWGFNHFPRTEHISYPTRIGSDNDWSDVSVGAGHCLALKKGGTLLVMGPERPRSTRDWDNE